MIRSLLIAASLTFAAGCASAGDSKTVGMDAGRNDGLADLVVEMSVGKPVGQIYISVFDSEASFKGSGEPVAQARAQAGESTQFSFEGLTPGPHAISAFHDMNGNGKFDMNALGIPTEPFAFSNNAAGRFGPATWEDAVFSVSTPSTLHTMEIK